MEKYIFICVLLFIESSFCGAKNILEMNHEFRSENSSKILNQPVPYQENVQNTYIYDEDLTKLYLPPLDIEVSPNSALFGSPSQMLQVTYIVTSNTNEPQQLYLHCTDTLRYLRDITPKELFLGAYQSSSVTVTLSIPSTAGSLKDEVTLHAAGKTNTKKVALVGARTGGYSDNLSPEITYRLTEDCVGYTKPETCIQKTWAVEFDIKDRQSGLKSVTSRPERTKKDYISGTTDIVKVYYTASCCNRKIDLWATDVNNNVRDFHIDIYIERQLSEGSIAAITLGCILLIAIIIIIIFLIICKRKNKESREIPTYSSHRTRT